MQTKAKMFIVASNIDESIKAVTPVYDITIFTTFVEFADYINNNPVIVDTVIVTETELPFTSVNMSNLLDVLSTSFLRLESKCIYLISNSTSKEVVQGFLNDIDASVITCYQGDLSPRYISEIVNGSARESDESETEVITYRYRASDYIAQQNIKKYETDEEDYDTDEDLLSEVTPVDEPEIVIPTIDVLTNCFYVVGKQSMERALFTLLEAQYLSLNGKVLIIESDVEYHRLTDMVLKSDIEYEYIDIDDFYNNCSAVINKIKASISNFIFIGVKKRIKFDYDFIFDIVFSNLVGYVDYFIKECDFVQTPYSAHYNIICEDNVPAILECIESLRYDIEEDKVVFVGLRTRDMGALNVSSSEMRDLVQVLLGKENVRAEVLTAYGINLKGDSAVYDIFSIIGRGNERQG